MGRTADHGFEPNADISRRLESIGEALHAFHWRERFSWRRRHENRIAIARSDDFRIDVASLVRKLG